MKASQPVIEVMKISGILASSYSVTLTQASGLSAKLAKAETWQ